MKHLILFSILLHSILLFSQDTLTLLYQSNKFQLTNQQKAKLKEIQSFQNVKNVKVFGYADYVGDPKSNQVLSQNRANKVRNYLISLNIEVLEVNGKGVRGETLNDNSGIAENRRVDIVYHKMKVVANSNTQEKEKQENKRLENEILKLNVGEKLILKNFNFIPGRHFLIAESKPELARLIDIMIENPSLKIEIHGHICCETTEVDGWDIDEMNYSLSTNRAMYIYQQLAKYGVSKDRMTYKGFSRTQPLYPEEKTEGEKKANRRVEILIVEK